jgi:hypothetical protein
MKWLKLGNRCVDLEKVSSFRVIRERKDCNEIVYEVSYTLLGVEMELLHKTFCSQDEADAEINRILSIWNTERQFDEI